MHHVHCYKLGMLHIHVMGCYRQNSVGALEREGVAVGIGIGGNLTYVPAVLIVMKQGEG